MLSFIMTFLMIKIIPEFEKIFVEFELELPKMTLLAVSLSQFTVNYLAVPVFWLIFGGTLAALLVGIFYLCDQPVLSWFGDRIFRGQRTADVLRILAVSTEHRQPLATVIQRLANVYPSRMLRRQLAPVAAKVARAANGASRSATLASLIRRNKAYSKPPSGPGISPGLCGPSPPGRRSGSCIGWRPPCKFSIRLSSCSSAGWSVFLSSRCLFQWSSWSKDSVSRYPTWLNPTHRLCPPSSGGE